MDDLECHLCGSCNLEVTDAGFPVCRDCGTALTTHTQEEIDGADIAELFANVTSRTQVRTQKKDPSKPAALPEWRITTLVFLEAFQHILQSQMRAIIVARRITHHSKAMAALKDLWFSYLKSLVEKGVHLDAVSLMARTSVNSFDPTNTPEISHPHWFWLLDFTLLWLTCVRIGEAVVPKDIIMWIKEGVIPFHSSFECLSDAMNLDAAARQAKSALFKPYFFPSTADIVHVASILQLRYNIDLQLEVTVGQLVRRVTVELGIDTNVGDVALRVMTIATAKIFDHAESSRALKCIGGAPPTVLACACVIIALKLCYQRFNLPHDGTLDPWTKAQLSRFALPIIRANVLKDTEELSPEERRWRHMSKKERATFLAVDRIERAAGKIVLKMDGRSDVISLDVWRAIRSEGKMNALIWWLHEITCGLRTPWEVPAPDVTKPLPSSSIRLNASDPNFNPNPTQRYTEFVPSEGSHSSVFEDLPNPYIAALLGASEIMGESPWAVHNYVCRVESHVVANVARGGGRKVKRIRAQN